MRTHRAAKNDRAAARRKLANLRTTRLDVRHELVSDDLVEQHWKFVADESDDE